jgi:hypothetical protein
MIRTNRFLPIAILALTGTTTAARAQYMPDGGTHMTAPGASLRATLNILMQEHAYLAAAATGAALAGRTGEFTAAAGALDMNSQALAGAVGGVYGKDAGTAFLGLWRRHIGIVVDYTTAIARQDKAGADKAVVGLIGYTQDLAAFLAGANPNLPKATVADLVKSHILTLKDVIDAQAAGDVTRAFTALRSAAGHMQMIADPLAEAIARQFPAKFTRQAGSLESH